jgi:glycine/D-amino acid oxidase-like deaminating enzyme
LALELTLKGKSIALVDNANPNASSRVAAGLINPIVPKGVRKTWLCDEIFSALPAYYSRMEKLLGQKFFTALPICQIHPDQRTADEWNKRTQQEEFTAYLSAVAYPLPESVKSPYGASNIECCGRLDTKLYLESAKEYLQKTQTFIEDTFRYSDVKFKNGVWNYQDFEAKGIIFCEGIMAMENPWFRNLHFHPTGGDILKLHVDATILPQQGRILKRKQWMIPLGEEEWLVGSNFHKGNRDETPKKEDADLLSEQIATWLNVPIKIIEHRRGVRPTVEGRRPYLGEHAEHKGLFIFNGLGSKGSSLVTILAPMMAEYLINKAPLNPEVDIERFNAV